MLFVFEMYLMIYKNDFTGLCWASHPSSETGSEKSEDKQQAVSYPPQVFFFSMCEIKVIGKYSANKS